MRLQRHLRAARAGRRCGEILNPRDAFAILRRADQRDAVARDALGRGPGRLQAVEIGEGRGPVRRIKADAESQIRLPADQPQRAADGFVPGPLHRLGQNFSMRGSRVDAARIDDHRDQRREQKHEDGKDDGDAGDA